MIFTVSIPCRSLVKAYEVSPSSPLLILMDHAFNGLDSRIIVNHTLVSGSAFYLDSVDMVNVVPFPCLLVEFSKCPYQSIAVDADYLCY